MADRGVFEPPQPVRERAFIKTLEEYRVKYRESLDDPADFWAPFVSEFEWKRKPSKEKTLSYNFDISKGPVHIEWFADGQTNICYNALDRNIKKGLGDKVAFHWVGNDPADRSSISFNDLHKAVCRFSHVLTNRLHVKPGDRVAIYMPMILELPIAMLACARIGAIHSVVFGGFSAQSLADRILDARSDVVITADGVFRGNKMVELKHIVDEALAICSQQKTEPHKISHCVVVRHLLPEKDVAESSTHKDVAGCRPYSKLNCPWTEGRDLWWHELVQEYAGDEFAQYEPKWVDAETPLFILYTSGSTGKPKGIVHTVAGYMVYTTVTFRYVFDYHADDPKEVFWCTADIGWITGHSYVVYGPLLNGATGVVFEGVPFYPDSSRYWQVVDELSVTQFYTAPTALRTLIKSGSAFINSTKRTSLRILGTVGEPINFSAWLWYFNEIGHKQCSIVDTYWQTETGGHVITPLPGCTPMKPGSGTYPFFGVETCVLKESNEIQIGLHDSLASGESPSPAKQVRKDTESNSNENGSEPPDLHSGHNTEATEGYLVMKRPWPSIARTIYGDHKRFEDTYFKKCPGYYMTGDSAWVDEEGYCWVTGRIDDMLNVSGHLMSTAEVESALNEHPAVAESAVVARAHAIKGECLYCFVTLRDGFAHGGTSIEDKTLNELRSICREKIGPFATPDFIQEAPALPKTRSGKIMRRILKRIAAGYNENFGDLTTLADENVIQVLIARRPPDAKLELFDQPSTAYTHASK